MRKFSIRCASVAAAFLVCWLLLIILEVRGARIDALKPIYVVSLVLALFAFIWTWKAAPWVTHTTRGAGLFRQIAGAIVTTILLALIVTVMGVNFKLLIGGSLQAHYNYFRDYDPSIGRYIESDPIGLVPGVGNSPTVPRQFTKYMQSVPLKERVQGGLNHSYAYVENNPLRLIDPFGLYGTSDCTYYQQRCKESGGVYYCYLAPAVCRNTPDNAWSTCVRQCLKEFDAGYCKRDNCGGGSDVLCIVNIHQMCWQECIGGGPPRTYPSPY